MARHVAFASGTAGRRVLQWAAVLCLLAALFCAISEAKVSSKRRVRHDATDDEPTIVDKLWTYFKIMLGMSPIFGIGLFAYCIRDSDKDEAARRKKTDGEALPGASAAPPVFLPGGGGMAGGGGGGGGGMGAAVY